MGLPTRAINYATYKAKRPDRRRGEEETLAFAEAALAAAKKDGLLLAVRARWVALAVIAVVSVIVNPHWEVLYYEAAVALFALIGLTGSAMMFRGAMKMSGKSDSEEFEFRGDSRTVGLLALEGAGVGLMTGLIGVGGGFLIVPALVFVANLPMRLAIGTSLLVITLNALSGFAGYLGTVPIDWQLVLWFTSIAAIGTIAGALISKRVPQKRLKQVFGVLLIGVSLYVLYRR